MMTAPAPDAPVPPDPFQFAMAERDAAAISLVADALAENRTRLAFQPIVLAQQPQTVAFYEGLVRVLDEGGRIIPARAFMGAIAETDLGRQIDTAALSRAFDVLVRTPSLRLSVNLSARSIADYGWRGVLDRNLTMYRGVGQRLIFEISETSAMFLHEVVVRFMRDMQPHGVSFALDGFGAGLTSFRHLKDFYFDMVKIDKSFAAGIAGDPDNQVLTEALVTVARQFEMFTVADGVEQPADLAFLQGLGVDCVQGNLIDVPRMHLARR